jgi:MFS family permease
LQAPFFPQEAERKGANATEYGLVFGIFELVVFLISPIYGQYLNRIGPKVSDPLIALLIMNFIIDKLNVTAGFIQLWNFHNGDICNSFRDAGSRGRSYNVYNPCIHHQNH